MKATHKFIGYENYTRKCKDGSFSYAVFGVGADGMVRPVAEAGGFAKRDHARFSGEYVAAGLMKSVNGGGDE